MPVVALPQVLPGPLPMGAPPATPNEAHATADYTLKYTAVTGETITCTAVANYTLTCTAVAGVQV